MSRTGVPQKQNKQNKTETDSYIQETNCWLPEWGGVGEAHKIVEES